MLRLATMYRYARIEREIPAGKTLKNKPIETWTKGKQKKAKKRGERSWKRNEKGLVCIRWALYRPLVSWLERPLPYFFQLRVIRAFRSNLEDLEERRSIHSLHSLHSMRSSRSHTGPRPLSDFTYIDEDPSNPILIAGSRTARITNNAVNDNNQDVDNRGTRINSTNSPASPLLLNVPGANNFYNHHQNHHHHHQHTNNGRTSSNSVNNGQAPVTNAVSNPRNPESLSHSPSSGSKEAMLSDLPKLVHETSIWAPPNPIYIFFHFTSSLFSVYARIPLSGSFRQNDRAKLTTTENIIENIMTGYTTAYFFPMEYITNNSLPLISFD